MARESGLSDRVVSPAIGLAGAVQARLNNLEAVADNCKLS